jgi:hypothetical protein
MGWCEPGAAVWCAKQRYNTGGWREKNCVKSNGLVIKIRRARPLLFFAVTVKKNVAIKYQFAIRL